MSSCERKLYGDELDEETERWLIENDKNFVEELRLVDKWDNEEGLYTYSAFLGSGDPEAWRDDAMFRQYEEAQREPVERKIGRWWNLDSQCLSL